MKARRGLATRIIAIPSELYPFKVVFYVGKRPSDAVFGRVARRHGLWNGEGEPISLEGAADAATFNFGSGSLVWLQRVSFRPKDMGLLAHELVHVLSNLSAELGQDMDNDTDEFHAYYAGWLVGQLVKRLK